MRRYHNYEPAAGAKTTSSVYYDLALELVVVPVEALK